MLLEKIIKSRTGRNYFVISAITVTVFVLVVLFLNKNFFGSLKKYEQVLSLYNDVASEDLNVGRIDEVMKVMNAKAKKRKIKIMLNFE